jgi:hypothetical protein
LFTEGERLSGLTVIRDIERSKLTQDQWDAVVKWRGDGYSHSWIARKVLEEFGVEISRERLGKVLGRRSGSEIPSEGARTVDAVLSPGEEQKVREIAAGLGIRILKGSRSGEGSISGLLRSLAYGEIEVRRSGRRRAG